jgi:hypothetical protein
MLRRVGTVDQLLSSKAEDNADLVEVLATPLGSMFSSVATIDQPRPIMVLGDSLEDGKVALPLDSTIIINETMRILHSPPTPLILVFTHTNPESEVRFRSGFPSSGMTVKCLSSASTLY